MKQIKKLFLRIFFGLEIVVFICMYIVGPQGLHLMAKLHAENKKRESEIAKIQHEVLQLEHTIAEFTTTSFQKEKIARERLQMARSGDIIFHVSNKQ